ncbi:chain length determinant protein EpsF [Ampullimonas aquatilis]|uniref:chain length determinant protein EpsF n=1 Tax=Ampullimonas aquatilis TaxID=1341549 RepID=UPI003C7180CA
MTLKQLLMVLKARRATIIGTFLVMVAAAIAITLVLPKQYLSSATVLVDLKTNDPLNGASGMTEQMMTAYMGTQMDIITGQKVAMRVVKTLKLADEQKYQEQFSEALGGKGSFDLYWAEKLQKNLDVKPSRESNIINIAYESNDPVFSARAANAFAKAYVDTSLELRVEPARDYTQWFDEKTKGLREKLEQAQAKVTDYQRRTGITSIDEKLDVENTRLIELSSQLSSIQAASSDTMSRQTQAMNGNQDTLQEVLNNPVISGLKSELVRKEATLQDLSQQLGKNHPQYERAVAEINELRAKLENETRRVANSISTSARVNVQREGDVRSSLAAQKERVLKLKQQREELAVLQREVENAERAYESVNQRLTQSTLESQTNRTNILQIGQALPPNKHSKPSLTLNTIAAAVLGTLLGLLLAWIQELRDRRIRSSDDLEILLGMEPLASIPALDKNDKALPNNPLLKHPLSIGQGNRPMLANS